MKLLQKATLKQLGTGGHINCMINFGEMKCMKVCYVFYDLA